MKKMIVACFLSLLSFSAMAETKVAIQCITDSKKEIVLVFVREFNAFYNHYTGELSVAKFSIDGKRFDKQVNLPRVYTNEAPKELYPSLRNYKDGRYLVMSIILGGSSSYQLEGGDRYSMECQVVPVSSVSADDRL